MVDFRLRLRNRGENSDEAEEMVLAIGQRAAYFSGTEHFVNLIAGNSLYGFSGIIILTELIREAFDNKKDTRKIIQIKAKGCCG